MSNKTRKYIWPVSLAMSLALIGAIAAIVAFGTVPPQPAVAHGPCSLSDDPTVSEIGAFADCVDAGGDLTHTHDGTPVPGTNVNEGSATKPSAPAMMSISRPTDNQARSVLPGDGELMIKWERPNEGGTPITGYDVRYTMTPADDDSWNSANDLPANKRSYVITGLTNGETYHVEVRAKNRLGNSPWSASRSGDPVAVPSAPMSLSVEGSESRIVVSWDAPASSGDHPIDRYNWDVDDVASNGRDSSGTFGSRQFRTMDMQMFFPQRGGAIITSVASDGNGCLEVTASASNATDDDPDGRTRALPGDEAMVTCAGAPTLTKQMVDNVAILRWDEPSLKGGAEVTEYVVRRLGYERINPTDTTKLGNGLGPEYREWRLGGSERSMWDTGLSHQTGYIYTIYAITDRYDLGYQPGRYKVSDRVTAFTSTDGGLILAPPSPPTAPRSLETMDRCDERITLSWMAPSNFGGGVDVDRNREWSHGKIVVSEAATIEKYDVQYRERGRGAWMDLSAMGTEATVTSGLEFGKTYDFRVRGKNNIGLYGPWASTTIELEEPPKPLQPTGLVVQATGPNTVELEWQAPDDSDTKPLWKTMADFDRAGDASNRLKYVIERQVNDGSWVEVHEQAHLYADEFEDNRTQAWADDNAPAGLVNYRVSAEVDECNRSPAHQKNAVEVLDPAAEFVGSVAAASAAGSATITWSPADNATSQVVIAVNPADDTDYCLAVKGSSDASHTCPGLTSGTSYVILVIALHSGGYTLGNVVTHSVN